MSEMLGITFFILSAVVSLLFIAGIAYLIFALVKKKDNDKPISLSVNILFKIYLYLISFITLILVVVGGATLIKSALSYAVDISFSYSLVEPNTTMDTKPIYPPEETYDVPECYEGKIIEVDGQRVCFDEEIRKQDLVNGVTFFVSMLIIFGIHQYGILVSEKKSLLMWLKKIYLFTNLIIFSIAGVIAIPASIYQTINYYLFTEDITSYSRQIPGMSIGIVILVLPLWIYFLIKTQKLQEDTEEEKNLQKK